MDRKHLTEGDMMLELSVSFVASFVLQTISDTLVNFIVKIF